MFPGETIETGANNGEYGANGFSELKVMQSAAGWYLGTTFKDEEEPWETPGSRETHYMSEKAAKEALEEWAKDNKVGIRK